MHNQLRKSNTATSRWMASLKNCLVKCLSFGNAFLARSGLRLVRTPALQSLQAELNTLHQERDSLIQQLSEAHQAQDALTTQLYQLRVRAGPPPKRVGDLSHRLGVIIPTINSEQYIGLILKYYREQNLDVHVLVDSKTQDKTFEIARGFSSTRIFENTSGVIEDALEGISKELGTEWVLRLDDDELPSRSMLDFIYGIIRCDDIDVVGFRRYQCAVSKSGLILFSQEFDSDKQRQWRLYRPLKLNFIKKIHTPGFRRVRQQSLKAPDEAFMIHLDWAVHSYSDRLLKLERYDRHTPGSGQNWRPYYLYEEQPHRFARLEAPEFDSLANDIKARFFDLCI